MMVFTAQLARQLLKGGFRIVDIKPDKNDKRRTVFIFQDSPELKQKMDEYIKARKAINKREEND